MLDPNRNRNQQYNDLPALPGAKPLATKAVTSPSLPAQAGTLFRGGQQRIVDAMKGAATGLTRPVVEPLLRNGPQVLASVGGGIEDFGRAAVGAGPRTSLVAPPIASPPPSLPLRKGEGQGGGRGGGLLPAAQAATPGPADGGTGGGVYAYGDSQQAFAFRHPLTGREHPYLTREQADAGLAAESARLQTPEGKAEVVRALNNRPFKLTSDGRLPEGIFNAQEMALVAPELRRVGLDGGKAESLGGDPSVTIAAPAPALPPPTPPSQGGGLTSSSPPLEGGAGGGPVDVIRGTKVSRADGGARGFSASDDQSYDALANIERDRGQRMSPQEQAQVDRASNEAAAAEGGGGSAVERMREGIAEQIMGGMYQGHAPDANTLALIKQFGTLPQPAQTAPLTRSQVEGQLLQKMNPDALTERDRLVFGKGLPAAPKVNTRKVYGEGNNAGIQIGQLDYALGPDGTYREVEVERAGAPGAPAAAGPSLGQFLAKARLDPRNAGVSDEDLTKHYRKTYAR